jgi:hypothetical protein
MLRGTAGSRNDLRRRLGWLGFGTLAPNLVIHPSPEPHALASALGDLPPEAQPLLFTARSIGRAAPAAIAREGWDLTALGAAGAASSPGWSRSRRASHAALPRRSQPWSRAAADPRVPAESCCTTRCCRRRCCPPIWAGATAHRLTARFYRRLAWPAERWVDEGRGGSGRPPAGPGRPVRAPLRPPRTPAFDVTKKNQNDRNSVTYLGADDVREDRRCTPRASTSKPVTGRSRSRTATTAPRRLPGPDRRRGEDRAQGLDAGGLPPHPDSTDLAARPLRDRRHAARGQLDHARASLRRKAILLAKVQDEAGHGLYLYAPPRRSARARESWSTSCSRQGEVLLDLQLPDADLGDIGAIGWLVDGAAIMNQCRSAAAPMAPTRAR